MTPTPKDGDRREIRYSPTADPPTAKLADDEHACRWCGVATDGEPVIEMVDDVTPFTVHMIPLGLCRECERRNDRAQAIADRLAGDQAATLAGSGGERRSPRLAAAVEVATVLRALHILGELGEGDPDFVAIEAIGYRLGRDAPAVVLAYEDYEPKRGKAATAPFGWITDDDRRALRRALKAARKDEAAADDEPVRVAPPGRTACGFCGVGSVEVDALAVRRAGGAKMAARDAWARRRAPVWVLCGSCAQAEPAGGVDAPTIAAMAAAGVLAEYVEAVEAGEAPRLPRIRPWCRARGTVAPGEPWEHLGGPEEVAKRVRAALAATETAPPTLPTLEEELVHRVERLERILAAQRPEVDGTER